MLSALLPQLDFLHQNRLRVCTAAVKWSLLWHESAILCACTFSCPKTLCTCRGQMWVPLRIRANIWEC